eukprot:1354950-Prymnesium_polylepis.2
MGKAGRQFLPWLARAGRTRTVAETACRRGRTFGGAGIQGARKARLASLCVATACGVVQYRGGVRPPAAECRACLPGRPR